MKRSRKWLMKYMINHPRINQDILLKNIKNWVENILGINYKEN